MTPPPPPAQLEVATPERVALSLPVAGVGHRCLAYLVDVLVLFAGWVALYFALTLALDVDDALVRASTLTRAVLGVAAFAAQWLYWTAWEVLAHGQTPGKRALAIRVVRADGAPVGLLDSALRNLLRAVDFLPLFYAVGVLCLLLTRQHRRLGDLVAGTLLVRDEAVSLDRYTPASAAAATPHAAPLPPADVELVLDFLARAPTLEPHARERLAAAFLTRYADLPAATAALEAASPARTEALLRARLG